MSSEFLSYIFNIVRKIFVAAVFVLLLWAPSVMGQESIRIDITPQPCANRAGCPVDLVPVYEARGEACVTDPAEFARNPTSNHYWVEDPKITDQGKADERARQFIYWTLSTRSLDDSPVLKNVWRLTSNITYFLVLFVAAMMGVGLIVGQRLRFETKVKVWPTIMKIVSILIYIAFSASIIILLIQLSEILMKFFLETLGGKDFFNIYFSTDPNEQINQQGGTGAGPVGAAATGSSESNYIGFVGCRDLNIRVQESVQAELFLFKATNITYYVMGIMLLLRKILLWFLLFVSPFAAILIPFAFIRNVAWIWLGVFFQWLFYGPLFALFLGAIATIWKSGIPFLFDFSRVDKIVGYVYPTAINITYGGPAQRLGALNNGNYVDTFAEYVITLIMLWAAIIFPWWLLRIFRDYCCDYLMAMKNILLNMYDQMRVSPSPLGPTPVPSPGSSRTTSTSQTIVNKTYNNMPVEQKLETMEQIRNTTTQNILKTVNVAAPKLVDIAKYETNKNIQTTAMKNIEYMKNPMKAETPVERQKFMNIRTELLNRALKEDKLAKQVLTSVSTSFVDQRENKTALSNQVYNAVSKTVDNSQAIRESIARNVVSKVANQQFDTVVTQSNTNKDTVIKTVIENTPASQSISSLVSMPQQTVNTVTNAITSSVSNLSTINNIAQNSNVDSNTVSQIYQSYQQNSTQSPTQIYSTIANNQSISNAVTQSMSTNQETINKISSMTNVSASDVQKITNQMSQVSSAPVSETTIIDNTAKETTIEREKVREVISQIKTHEKQGAIGDTTINQISTQTQVPAASVRKIVERYQENQNPETRAVSQISQRTQIQREKVREVMSQITTAKNEKVKEVLNQIRDTAQQSTTATNIITQVAQTTQITAPVIEQILQTWNQNISQNPTQIINKITNNTQVNNALHNAITNNNESINSISNETNIDGPQVKNIMQTWNTVTNTAPAPSPEQVIERVATETNTTRQQVKQVIDKTQEMKKEKVREVIKQVHEQVSRDKAIVRRIAKDHNIKEEEVQKIADAQKAIVTQPVSAPEIEKKIPLPATVSIEDYEAVKQMWQKQYETGEIPVQENIQTRNEWVEHDSIFITNALNKLTSEDEEMRQQGLDDIGYILPIFMINNFKGEEMLVYLKAKLQAAKTVQAQLEREEQLKEEILAKDEDDKVTLDVKKKDEQEKTMEMEQSMTIDGQEEKKPDENTEENGSSGTGTPPTT